MTRRIRSGTAASQAMLRGIEQMVGLVRPTLGPLPRTVAVSRPFVSQPPEVLDNAALILRRTLELADPFENMGAMVVRHLVWRVFERAGDGGATAAVLTHALVREGNRLIAAGVSSVGLRRGMERAAASVADALRQQAQQIDGQDAIARVVGGSVGDAALADLIGEVLDAVGTDGAVIVEDAPGTRTEHEYIDGVRWHEGYVSSFLMRRDETTSTRVLNPRILVTDHVVERAEDLIAALEVCVADGDKCLMVIAPEVRDNAIGMLVTNRERGVLDGVMAVKAPSFGDQRLRILEDIAAITGGRCVSQERGERLADVRTDDLGRARHAWATIRAFGILGGRGNKAAIRERIAEAKAELRLFSGDDNYTRNLIMERIGKLAGLAAVIRVGGATRTEQEERKVRVEAAVKAARSALQEGVVPGGGAALLACAALARRPSGLPEEERLGVEVVMHALAEPMRVIVRNAGFEHDRVVAQARCCPGLAFDVLSGQWTAELSDPLATQLAALDASTSAAVSVLSSEVLVHRKQPPTSMQP